MPSELEVQFHEAMLDIYRRAKSEAGYNATRFIGMVVERGGLDTARYLMALLKFVWVRNRLKELPGAHDAVVL